MGHEILDKLQRITELNRASGTSAGWLRPLLGLLSPDGPSGRLSILIFHRVHPLPDDLFPNESHATAFQEQMMWIRSCFNVLPLDEAVTALTRGSLPARAVVITFDDGYSDNHRVALPILRQLGLHATFFIATAFIDGGRMWNDTVIEGVRKCEYATLDLDDLGLGRHPITTNEERRLAIAILLSQLKYLPQHEREDKVTEIGRRCGTALPNDLMLTVTQLREMRDAGMTIGAHTVSHPILAGLSDVDARYEIERGKVWLEHALQEPVRFFAYPNGKPGADYGAAHVRMVCDLGFKAAVSTARGAAQRSSDVFQLPRFTPWGRGVASYGLRMAQNLARRNYATA